MIRKYLTQQQYDDLDGKLNSNVDYVIVENGSPINVTFVTNNITGLDEMYDFAPTPEGSYNITENGEYDVAAYASAYVDVPSGDKWLPIYVSSLEGTLTTLDDNTVPNDVSYIRPYAFYNYKNIASINVSSVTYVEADAFGGCKALTSAYMPSVAYVGANAFNNCNALTSAYMPSVKKIESTAFGGCKALTSAYMPSVTYVGNYAFVDCNALTSAYMPSVTYVGNYAFHRCYALSSVYMPLVKNIGQECFRECNTLSYVELPSIEVLGNIYSSGGVFYFCVSLATVDLGPNITTIGEDSFVGCNALTSFTCRATTPPKIYKDMLSGAHTDLVIYVPAESVDAYKAATDWSAYADRIQAIVE